MNQGDVVTIHSRKDIEQRTKHILKRINDWDYETPIAITLKPYTNPRTISQNAMLHMWCRQLSAHYLKKVDTATPENMKLMMKQRFLGVEDIKIGKTIIQSQVKHSSGLDKGAMVHFLDQVYHWGKDNGVLLSVPLDSEYEKLKNQQVE